MTEKYNKEVKKIFLNKLEKYTDIAARQLYDRYKFQCSAVAKQFPLLMSGLWQGSENLKPNDKVALNYFELQVIPEKEGHIYGLIKDEEVKLVY